MTLSALMIVSSVVLIMPLCVPVFPDSSGVFGGEIKHLSNTAGKSRLIILLLHSFRTLSLLFFVHSKLHFPFILPFPWLVSFGTLHIVHCLNYNLSWNKSHIMPIWKTVWVMWNNGGMLSVWKTINPLWLPQVIAEKTENAQSKTYQAYVMQGADQPLYIGATWNK